MSTTGANLLVGFSRFLGDELIVGGSAATGNGSTTTLVDTTLGRFADDALIDFYVRITQSGTNQFAIRRITDFVSSTGTVTVSPAFAASTSTSDTYQLHRFDPAEKFTALDVGRLSAYPDVAQIIYDTTTTADGISSVFDTPAAIRRGPTIVQVESPAEVEASWNFIQDQLGNATTNWTASNTTASIVTGTENDRMIPKYDPTCTKLATAGSNNGQYSQVVGSMTNNITAALAGGRRMTFGMWVYCRTASRVTLQIVDDTATTSSGTHQGLGWELLTVTRNVPAANATTLTVRVNVSSDTAAVDLWWNRAWFYFGDAHRITDIYRRTNAHIVRRDDTTQTFNMEMIPQRGRQLRLIGRDHLSALGTTASTQVTNAMEVDEAQAQLLYAYAARALFSRQGLSLDDFPDVAQRIAEVEIQKRDLRTKWSVYLPSGGVLKSAWAV